MVGPLLNEIWAMEVGQRQHRWHIPPPPQRTI
jgi:hypothetical protein